MVRSIAAVVVSYIVLMLLTMGMFAGMVFGFGIDGLLKPNSFQGNMIITILAPSITLIAGLVGGLVCAKIGRSKKTVMVFAGLVLILGFVQGFVTLQKPFPADPRDPNMTLEQFLAVGREPTWIVIFNPIGGAIAVLVGGLVLGGRKVG